MDSDMTNKRVIANETVWEDSENNPARMVPVY